jgi:hypothetical protein
MNQKPPMTSPARICKTPNAMSAKAKPTPTRLAM